MSALPLPALGPAPVHARGCGADLVFRAPASAVCSGCFAQVRWPGAAPAQPVAPRPFVSPAAAARLLEWLGSEAMAAVSVPPRVVVDLRSELVPALLAAESAPPACGLCGGPVLAPGREVCGPCESADAAARAGLRGRA